MKMKAIFLAAALALGSGAAGAQQFDYGFAGLMGKANRVTLPDLTLGSGKPVQEAPVDLKSGAYYKMKIVADGSAELALSGGDFFRAIWINEIVINNIEVRPMGVHSLEFDAAGEAEISFIAVVPGSFSLSIPGSSGDSQKAVFNIR
ncbi:hypothetical protein [Pseudogemmobacter faecipullorum]|uniref:MSP domain-containing protein n=1 Tax=Pseudogemmobacter faecipullorum TaxID=2755041 RepID=A0ABS8CII3_9RHOB|nr:hypothetical protein [Pseudogemmobacter faecipullorum]MCB5409217.1 hypothetical protein [Pseudogemmobacter faecipullorum]